MQKKFYRSRRQEDVISERLCLDQRRRKKRNLKKKKHFLLTIRSREHMQRTVFGYVDAVSAAEFRCHEDQRHPGWGKKMSVREGRP